MKHFPLFVTFLFPFFLNAQVLFTKDSLPLGPTSLFVSKCVEGIAEDSVELNGLNIASDKYCSCMAKEFIPSIESELLMKAANEGEEGIVSLLMQEPYFSILMKCAEHNLEIEDSYKVGESKYTEFHKIKV